MAFSVHLEVILFLVYALYYVHGLGDDYQIPLPEAESIPGIHFGVYSGQDGTKPDLSSPSLVLGQKPVGTYVGQGVEDDKNGPVFTNPTAPNLLHVVKDDKQGPAFTSNLQGGGGGGSGISGGASSSSRVDGRPLGDDKGATAPSELDTDPCRFLKMFTGQSQTIIDIQQHLLDIQRSDDNRDSDILSLQKLAKKLQDHDDRLTDDFANLASKMGGLVTDVFSKSGCCDGLDDMKFEIISLQNVSNILLSKINGENDQFKSITDSLDSDKALLADLNSKTNLLENIMKQQAELITKINEENKRLVARIFEMESTGGNTPVRIPGAVPVIITRGGHRITGAGIRTSKFPYEIET